MGICYRLPHQEEAVHDAFKQLKKPHICRRLVLVLSHFDIYWKNNTTVHKRFVECTDDNNFLTHVINKPMRAGAFLDLTLTSEKDLGRHMKVEPSWL